MSVSLNITKILLLYFFIRTQKFPTNPILNPASKMTHLPLDKQNIKSKKLRGEIGALHYSCTHSVQFHYIDMHIYHLKIKKPYQQIG